MKTINDQAVLDERAQKIQSLIQTIHTAIPGLPPSPPASVPDSDEDSPYVYPRTGKVARLQAAVRETVNLMLNDNAPYQSIIEKLAALGHPGFVPSNITHWKQGGGFREWLDRRHQAESLCATARSNLQLLKEITGEEQQALSKMLELAFASHLLAAFARFNPAQMPSECASETLSRFANALARHFRERTRYEALLLAIRKHQSTPSEEQKSTANAATARKLLQISAMEGND